MCHAFNQGCALSNLVGEPDALEDYRGRNACFMRLSAGQRNEQFKQPRYIVVGKLDVLVGQNILEVKVL